MKSYAGFFRIRMIPFKSIKLNQELMISAMFLSPRADNEVQCRVDWVARRVCELQVRHVTWWLLLPHAGAAWNQSQNVCNKRCIRWCNLCWPTLNWGLKFLPRENCNSPGWVLHTWGLQWLRLHLMALGGWALTPRNNCSSRLCGSFVHNYP